MLSTWASGDIEEPGTLKGHLAEFVACLGPEVAEEMVVDFRSGR